MKRRSADPEREIVKRAAPFGPPLALSALVLGGLAGGWGIGVSAALGIVIVTLNLVASGLATARAAHVSLTVLSAVVAGGVVVRLAVIVATLALLKHFASWFSVPAFVLAVIPATVLLLIYEMKLLSSGLGAELQIPPPAGAVKRRMAP
jgi:hypothetical protein